MLVRAHCTHTLQRYLWPMCAGSPNTLLVVPVCHLHCMRSMNGMCSGALGWAHRYSLRSVLMCKDFICTGLLFRCKAVPHVLPLPSSYGQQNRPELWVCVPLFYRSLIGCAKQYQKVDVWEWTHSATTIPKSGAGSRTCRSAVQRPGCESDAIRTSPA